MLNKTPTIISKLVQFHTKILKPQRKSQKKKPNCIETNFCFDKCYLKENVKNRQKQKLPLKDKN